MECKQSEALLPGCLVSNVQAHEQSVFCEGEGDVVAVVAPLGGVAQVIFHGVQVVEVGVQVRVRKEGEKEEDGEVQVEVEKERSKRIKEKRSSWMA